MKKKRFTEEQVVRILGVIIVSRMVSLAVGKESDIMKNPAAS